MTDTPSSLALLDHFSALKDPRQQWKILYPLNEILLLVLAATLAGGDDFVEIELWGNEQIDFLRTFLPYASGIPSHDALNDLINALDPELFKDCFANWVASLRDDDPDIVAIDGKTSRRAHARSKGQMPLHTVSAWASRQRLVLGQQAVDEKSNEIKAIPLLLERLALAGALVTIDAMGTQTDIADKILEQGGDYCLALKGNHPLLFAEVERFFADPAAEIDGRFETVDGDHGRVEVRRHAVCHAVDWLFSDKRYTGEPRFPGIKMVGMVESVVERDGRIERARRYYLLSTALGAEGFARAVRAHWGVENNLHWSLDVVYHDDLMRLRTGSGAENMAVVKHMAVNLMNATKPTTSLKNRRKKAGWNCDYLGKVIRGTA